MTVWCTSVRLWEYLHFSEFVICAGFWHIQSVRVCASLYQYTRSRLDVFLKREHSANTFLRYVHILLSLSR